MCPHIAPGKANEIVSCGKIAEMYLEYVKPYNDPTKSLIFSAFFIGYVSGYIYGDSGDKYSHFNIPDGVDNGQLAHVVGKYLQAHPEKWHLGMNQCVYDALRATWPNN